MNLLQKKLVDAEHALLDLEERYRKANSTIKFKEFLISALLKSGKIIYYTWSSIHGWQMLYQIRISSCLTRQNCCHAHLFVSMLFYEYILLLMCLT